jgi:hypothetical protein
LVACPSPPKMAPGCLPYSSLVRILSFSLHSPSLARWGICALVWELWFVWRSLCARWCEPWGFALPFFGCAAGG